MKPKTPPLTEEEMLRRLKARYTEDSGNGAAWAFMPGVRSAAGFDSRRTIDGYAMSLWPSRGLALHAFECKSSRSDWRRELKNAAKAEEFCQLADYFWLVVGEKGIVWPGELPETWGLLVPHGKGLKAEVEAPRLRPASAGVRVQPLPPGVSRSYLAALLRAATYVANTTPDEIRAAEQRGRDSEAAIRKLRGEDDQTRLRALQERVRAFEREAGFQIGSSETWAQHSPEEVGAAVKMVLGGGKQIKVLEERLTRIRSDARSIAEHAAQLLPEDSESSSLDGSEADDTSHMT